MTPTQLRGSVVAASLLALVGCTGDIAGGPLAEEPAGSSEDGTPGVPGVPGMAGSPGTKTGPGGTMPGTPPGPVAATPVAGTRFARLSHRQWENTVRDLLRRDPGATPLSPNFLPDPDVSRFDNNATSLSVQPQLWLDYQRAAETLAADVTRSPEAMARVLPPNLPADASARPRAFIEAFGLRAYRRPLTPDETTRYQALFAKGPTLVGSGDAFADGVRMVVEAMLQSPYFLYRTELETRAVGGKIPLTDYEVASRLSLAFTGTMPDDALFAAAAAHKLQDRDTVRAQATRLLATPAGQTAMVDFHDQLVGADDFAQITKDTTRFPFWKPEMARDAQRELEMFVREVTVTRGGGLGDLLTAPYTFVNPRLAPVYGVAAPAGSADTFSRTDLPGGKRAGLLTQLGFLARYATTAERNSILRGVFVSERILCTDLPPPPDNVPPPPAPKAGQTNRQRIDSHTGKGTCGEGCHSVLINPAGFAFENFDAAGRYQTTDASQPIDASGSYLLDGESRSFKDAVEFVALLAGSRQANECYMRNWMEYVHGRFFDEDHDRGLVASLAGRSLAEKASIKSLLVDLVANDSFLTRAP
jgi:hypothetical protein